jgi:hypothetical protein
MENLVRFNAMAIGYEDCSHTSGRTARGPAGLYGVRHSITV